MKMPAISVRCLKRPQVFHPINTGMRADKPEQNYTRFNKNDKDTAV
jgi:hypothetical protein